MLPAAVGAAARCYSVSILRNILIADAGRVHLPTPRMEPSIGGRTMNRQWALVLLIALAMPASAGTTQVSGVGVFNDACQPPVGSPPADPGDYAPIELTGSLHGCRYTYVSSSRFNRSGTYQETGTETFVG